VENQPGNYESGNASNTYHVKAYFPPVGYGCCNNHGQNASLNNFDKDFRNLKADKQQQRKNVRNYDHDNGKNPLAVVEKFNAFDRPEAFQQHQNENGDNDSI
jgi:hypothetical protein